MDHLPNFKLTDVRKARLFPGAISRTEAGYLPIQDTENDLRRMPPLKGDALRRWWAEVLDHHGNHLSNTVGERRFAAWRILRQSAIDRGVIQPDEPLEAIARSVPLTSTTLTSFIEISNPRLRALLAPGVSVTPPDVPRKYLLENGAVDASYETEDDPKLVAFVALVEYYARKLLLRDDPHSRRGVPWLVDADLVRAGWPSFDDLVKTETEMVFAAVEYLAEKSARNARKEIAAAWGLSPEEVGQIHALAMKALAIRTRLQDRDGNKAAILAMLDNAYEKALDALDHRGAAMIQRERWRIFRDRAEEDIADDFEEMSNVIASNASEKRGKPLLEG